MRRFWIAAIALSLMACSAGPGVSVDVAIESDAASASEPPVITFVRAPSELTRDDMGTYTLGIVLSYTDDTEQVVSFSFDSDALTLTDTLPSASNGMTILSLTLPRETSTGTLGFKLRILSSSGVPSAAYSDVIFLE